MTVKIIAEIGINSNGNLGVLHDMIKAAKECGADYIKIQKRHIDLCYSEEELAKPCESPWGDTVEDKVRGRELSWDAINLMNLWCKEVEIDWFSSCFDLRSLKELHENFPNRPFNKIPSAMIHREYLEAVAEQGLTTLISTGLCRSYDHVKKVCAVFVEKKCPFVINHCVALYPCPNDRLNLLNIQELRNRFRKNSLMRGVGYSGHETGVLPSVIAAQLGATFIERHFTLDRSMYGADQAASLEPEGLRRLVRDVHSLDTILGIREKKLVGDEKVPVKKFPTN